MNSKLLVVADLGRMRAYRLEESPLYSKPRLKLIEDYSTNIAQHLGDEVTDQAGQRKTKGSAVGQPHTMSDGEQHNLDLERRRRAVRAIASRVSALLRDGTQECYLAADSRLNEPLLLEMDAGTRSKVTKNVTANLSKLSADEVISHFCE